MKWAKKCTTQVKKLHKMGFREVLYVTGKCGTIVWIPSYMYSLYKLQVRTNSTQRLDELKHKFCITLMNLEPIKTWPIMFLLSKAQLCFCFSVFINRLKLRLLRMLQISILVTDLSKRRWGCSQIGSCPSQHFLPLWHNPFSMRKWKHQPWLPETTRETKKISKLDFNPSSPDKAWLRDPTFC